MLIVLAFHVFYSVLWKTVLKMQLNLKLILLKKKKKKVWDKSNWQTKAHLVTSEILEETIIHSLRNWDIKENLFVTHMEAAF